MTACQRHLCMASLRGVLVAQNEGPQEYVDSDSVELEHAIFVISKGHEIFYPLQALRALKVLEEGKTRALRSQNPPRSYLDILQLPAAALFHSLPCYEARVAEESRRVRGEALLRDLSSPDLSDIPDAGTRCTKCRSSDISFDFLQTRSADEGTTVYCTCISCGTRWKM